jgi:hypothetical protein
MRLAPFVFPGKKLTVIPSLPAGRALEGDSEGLSKDTDVVLRVPQHDI